MVESFIEFPWYRDSSGYELFWDYPEKKKGYAWIASKGGAPEPLGLIEKKIDELCFEFSRLKTPEDLLEFIRQNGMVNGGRSFGPTKYIFDPATQELTLVAGQELLPAGGPGDNVFWCLESAKLFDELLRIQYSRKRAEFYLSKAADHFRDTNAEAELVPHARMGIAFRFKTKTLFGALLWHLAHLLRSDVNIRVCLECSRCFEVGPGALRSDAVFCCKEHKIKHLSRTRPRQTDRLSSK
jgi:hypothetical protein